MSIFTNPFKKEPAVVIGFLVAVLSGVGELFTNDPNLTWTSALPLIVGVVVRRFVTPALASQDKQVASYSVNKSKHATLTSTTVDTITISGPRFTNVEVKNWDTTNKIYFTTDGTTPTSGGDDTFVVGPGEANMVSVPQDTDTIKILGNGNAYSVIGVENFDE